MTRVLVVSTESAGNALPALELLGHTVETRTPLGRRGADAEVVLVDARVDLVRAKRTCQELLEETLDVPVISIHEEGGLVAVSPEWGVSDVVLCTAGPAEVETRIRLALRKPNASTPAEPGLRVGTLVIDEESYTCTVSGRVLDLTYKEFELLRHLAKHPGRVFTRGQLLSEVWGYDYYGGTRTVDVHVRRLRAKLGEHEALVGTVRNVGYKLSTPPAEVARVPAQGGPESPIRA